MHKRQKQFNPSGIKWPTKVDMPLNETKTQISFLSYTGLICYTQFNNLKYCSLIIAILFIVYSCFIREICKHLYGLKKLIITIPTKRLTSSICLIDVAFTRNITPSQSGPESNSNEVILYSPQNLWVEPYPKIQFYVESRTLNSFKYYAL